MKQTPQFQRIQELMQPGILTKDGFLGDDNRNLVDIINEDERALVSLGISGKEIADKMTMLLEAGREGFGNPILVDDIFEVTVENFMGKIPSPFGGIFNKENAQVVNLRTMETICWTNLSIEMIREHNFFQGKGSKYRIDPKLIVDILEIKPD